MQPGFQRRCNFCRLTTDRGLWSVSNYPHGKNAILDTNQIADNPNTSYCIQPLGFLRHSAREVRVE